MTPAIVGGMFGIGVAMLATLLANAGQQALKRSDNQEAVYVDLMQAVRQWESTLELFSWSNVVEDGPLDECELTAMQARLEVHASRPVLDAANDLFATYRSAWRSMIGSTSNDVKARFEVGDILDTYRSKREELTNTIRRETASRGWSWLSRRVTPTP